MEHHFNIQIAKVYGVFEAIFLNNIAHWVQKNILNQKNFHKNTFWTYNSQPAFLKLFPYWSIQTLKTVIKNCINNDLISVDNFNEKKYDRTCWYSLTNKGLSLFNGLKEEHDNAVLEKNSNRINIGCFQPMHKLKSTDASVETNRPIPNIKPDNKQRERERIKRACPLPKDFALNEESKKLCADLGLKEDVMLTKFKALAKDKAWRSADWQAKFQLIAAKEYKTAAIPQAVKQETKTYKDEIYTPCSVCQRPKLHCECNYNSREQNAMQSAKLKALLQGKLLNK